MFPPAAITVTSFLALLAHSFNAVLILASNRLTEDQSNHLLRFDETGPAAALSKVVPSPPPVSDRLQRRHWAQVEHFIGNLHKKIYQAERIFLSQGSAQYWLTRALKQTGPIQHPSHQSSSDDCKTDKQCLLVVGLVPTTVCPARIACHVRFAVRIAAVVS